MLYVVMQALELMKTHVVKTTPDAPLGEAVDLMDLYQVNGLPVVDANEVLCGMLTECDVLRALEHVANQTAVKTSSESEHAEALHEPAHKKVYEQDGQDAAAAAERLLKTTAAAQRRVGDYMTQPAISISEHAPAHQAARLLLTSHLKRIPVTDEHGHVVGVLNRVDVFQAIFEQTIFEQTVL